MKMGTKIFNYLREEPILLLLLAAPLAIVAHYGGWGDLWVFALSAIGVIPLAGLIGDATEALADHTGPRLGGLLNATLGNAAELIITIAAIREGLIELTKASITGSILGNLLLVLGMSMVLGGTRHGTQSFDRRQASNNSILLVLAMVALLIPSLLSASIGPETSLEVEAFSLGVAGIMIVLYVLGLLFSFRSKKGPMVHTPLGGELGLHAEERPKAGSPGAANKHVSPAERSHKGTKGEHKGQPSRQAPLPGKAGESWPLRTALIVLALATIGVAYMSELLVGAVEPVVQRLGVSEFFLGVVLIPIVGNVAEHLVAVKMARENHMDLSVEIAVASSLQIALFVAPVLVFISLVLGNPMRLIFNQFEMLALVAGVAITALVSMDGESNWLEGAELLAVYLILALAFFLHPA